LSTDEIDSFASLNPKFAVLKSKSTEEDGEVKIQYQDLKEGIRWADSKDISFIVGELTITLDKINILFVIDNSRYMEEEKKSIVQQFDSFLTSLQGKDYNIAITTTDTFEGNRGGGVFRSFSNGQKWLTGTRDTTPADITQNAQYFQKIMESLGSDGSPRERGLFATLKALEREDQKKFFRPNALLMIVIISDEDEHFSPTLTNTLNSASDIDEHFAATAIDLQDNIIKSLYDKFYNLYSDESDTYGASPIVIHSIVGVPKGDDILEDIKNKAKLESHGKYGSFLSMPYFECPGIKYGFKKGYTYEKASQGVLFDGTDLKKQYGNIIPGQVLSNCETNYDSQLKPISEQTINNRVVSLPCRPNSKENVFIVTPDGENFYPDRLEGNNAYIEKDIPLGAKINIYFTCPK